MVLSRDRLDPQMNDLPGSWCSTTTPYGNGLNRGSPNFGGELCPR
jgi:hypothetical protein